MQTVTVEINNKNGMKALEALEQKHFIKIVEATEVDSPALPGEPISIAAFKNWISAAENTDTISLSEAKQKWASRKKLLQKNTK